ncbi:hypothetical protein [Streptomyces sp. NPDC058326]|uniref:hypothetical protein n=1 Tax=Streptomyces sp. NPDC058326 TaxID=3346447 RepID=UPI0036E3B1EE
MAKKTSPKDRAGRQAKMAPKGKKRPGAEEAARAPEHQAAERETRTTYSEG